MNLLKIACMYWREPMILQHKISQIWPISFHANYYREKIFHWLWNFANYLHSQNLNAHRDTWFDTSVLNHCQIVACYEGCLFHIWFDTSVLNHYQIVAHYEGCLFHIWFDTNVLNHYQIVACYEGRLFHIL